MSKEQAPEVKVASVTAKFAFGGAVIGGIIGFLGTALPAYLTYSNRDKEVDLELAKLSLSMLADAEGDQELSMLPARRFAVKALLQGTRVELSDEDIEYWVTQGDTPKFSKFDWGYVWERDLQLRFCDAVTLRKFTEEEVEWRAENAPENLKRDYAQNLTYERECLGLGGQKLQSP